MHQRPSEKLQKLDQPGKFYSLSLYQQVGDLYRTFSGVTSTIHQHQRILRWHVSDFTRSTAQLTQEASAASVDSSARK